IRKRPSVRACPALRAPRHSRAFDRARRLPKEQNETIRSDLLYDPGKTVSEALIGLGSAGARLLARALVGAESSG
ncbi:MAG TPA: hypothetical protein PKX20_11135, partial [Methanothrix soehngenii]|nr:hypothetical protein [Methanothrix soehngenii]